MPLKVGDIDEGGNKVISPEKITFDGFSSAMFDVFLMGVYLLAFLALISHLYELIFWQRLVALGIVLFLLQGWLSPFMKLLNPMEYYQTEYETEDKDGTQTENL